MDRSRVPSMLAVALAATLLVAGCVTTTNQPDGDDAPAANFRSQGQYGMEWERIDIPDKVAPGTEERWLLRAINTGPEGENEFTYKDGCGEPWHIVLTGPGGQELDWEGDVVRCQGFTEKTFAGGDAKDFQWEWDGRVWDGSAWQDAPRGQHTLSVTFEALHAGIHESAATAVVTFHVV